MFLSKKSFTLIELLIVIAIIGILSGVVLAVINPATQRNRSKDAIIVSTLTKLSLVLSVRYSTNLSDPSFVQLMAEVNNLVRCSDSSVPGNGAGNSFIMNGIDVNWKSSSYCTNGGFYYYQFAGQPGCIGTMGFTLEQDAGGVMRNVWYVTNRTGKIKKAAISGVSMYHMCQNFDDARWTTIN